MTAKGEEQHGVDYVAAERRHLCLEGLLARSGHALISDGQLRPRKACPLRITEEAVPKEVWQARLRTPLMNRNCRAPLLWPE